MRAMLSVAELLSSATEKALKPLGFRAFSLRFRGRRTVCFAPLESAKTGLILHPAAYAYNASSATSSKYHQKESLFMGCLGFWLELVFDSILDGYIALMQWIVPQKRINKHFQVVLKIIVGIFTAFLLITMFLGILAINSRDEDTRYLGRYMVFIPLAISFVQIAIGIIFRTITRKKQ